MFEIFRDMASDYGNPKPSLFASEHLSPQSEGGCERTVANRAALHCGWQGCVFPARSKDPKHSNNMKRDRPAEIHENKNQTTHSSCLLWKQEEASNLRPPGYAPDALPTALSRDVSFDAVPRHPIYRFCECKDKANFRICQIKSQLSRSRNPFRLPYSRLRPDSKSG